MEIQLQTLVLQNFMGGSFVLAANDEDINIYGTNGSGKTRLASGLSWLLFDKDSLGRSDFEIKNLNDQGQEEHGLEHSVEGIFSVDGAIIALKKSYKEIWSKKRGNPRPVFSGHTTDCYIDGVPVQKKEYTARVIEIAGDESAFRLLTSPVAFPSLHWQKQRTLLLEICGDITDLQVIESDGTLHPLIDLLAKYKGSKKPFDDMKSVIVARRTEINKVLEAIPVRIDEVKKGLPDISGIDRIAIADEITGLEDAIGTAKGKLQGIDNGADIAELTKRLITVNSDIQRLEQAHYNGHMFIANRIAQEIRDLTNQKLDAEKRRKSVNAEIEDKQSRLKTLETHLRQLRQEWTEVNAEIFDPNKVAYV